MQTLIRKPGHQLDRRLSFGCGLDRAVHDLADVFCLVGIDAWGGCQPLPDALTQAEVVTRIELGMLEKVDPCDDTDHVACAVHHGQRADAVTVQQGPGLVQRRGELHRHQITRHDVGTAHDADVPLPSLHLGLPHEFFERITVDVHQLIRLVGARDARRTSAPEPGPSHWNTAMPTTADITLPTRSASRPPTGQTRRPEHLGFALVCRRSGAAAPASVTSVCHPVVLHRPIDCLVVPRLAPLVGRHRIVADR